MSKQTVETIDLDQLTDVTGGNSYVDACYEGAKAGALRGLAGGPRSVFTNAVLGCLGNVARNAIERNT